MSPGDEQVLQDVYRRERRSLVQYTRDAAPYAAGADRKLLAEIQRVADESAAESAALGDFLTKNQIRLPHLGSFPVAFTDLNFVGVGFLLPKLVAELKRDLAAREAAAAMVADPEARAAVARLVESHRRHLTELEALG